MVPRRWSSKCTLSLRTKERQHLIILSPSSDHSPPPESLLYNLSQHPTRKAAETGGQRSQHKCHKLGVRGLLGWGIVHRSLSHISVCCSLIPTALYYNAQMDADMEPSKSLLGTVPTCNLPFWQCVCGVQWLHSWATCSHHELLQTWAPHQELRLHGGRRCAHPTAFQPHAVVPNNWWQRQYQWDSRSHRLLQ